VASLVWESALYELLH